MIIDLLTYPLPISHPSKGLIDYVPFEFQIDLTHTLRSKINVIIKKSRQLGVSTALKLYAIEQVINRPGITIGYVCPNSVSGKQLQYSIHRLFTSLKHKNAIPNLVNEGIELPECKARYSEFQYSNRSTIELILTAQNFHGRSFDIIIMDEIAFLSDAESACDAAISCLKPDSQLIIASTPHKDDFFWKLWSDAVTAKNYLKPIELRWRDNPSHDDKWFETMKNMLSYEAFQNEVLCQIT